MVKTIKQIDYKYIIRQAFFVSDITMKPRLHALQTSAQGNRQLKSSKIGMDCV